MRTWTVGALVVWGLCGCAGSRAQERWAQARASVRAAREVGAEASPRAALHLAYAEQQLAQARALMEHGDPRYAALVLERAQADAELAWALAKVAQETSAAQAVLLQVRALRKGTSVATGGR